MSEEKELAAELNILTQYVKDVSFESPHAPQSLKGAGGNPNVEFSINIGVKKVEENTFEVAIEFAADVKNNEGYIYKLEVVYAGLFMLKGVPEKYLQRVLLVNCPTLLFPFLRHTVMRLVQDGGFPPLPLDPIDFERLYQENIEHAEKEQNEQNPVLN